MGEPGVRRIGKSAYYEQYEPSTVTREEYYRLREEGDGEKRQIKTRAEKRAGG